MPLQDDGQPQVITRYVGESPGDTETAGCPVGVAVVRTDGIIAVLDGQDVDATTGRNMLREKVNLADVPFLTV